MGDCTACGQPTAEAVELTRAGDRVLLGCPACRAQVAARASRPARRLGRVRIELLLGLAVCALGGAKLYLRASRPSFGFDDGVDSAAMVVAGLVCAGFAMRRPRARSRVE